MLGVADIVLSPLTESLNGYTDFVSDFSPAYGRWSSIELDIVESTATFYDIPILNQSLEVVAHVIFALPCVEKGLYKQPSPGGEI